MANPFQDQIDQLQAKIAENELLLSDPELGELAQAEITNLQTQLAALEEAAQAFESGQEDGPSEGEKPKNCIIEIRGGAGGDEAKIWAGDLLRMYIRFAETLGLKIEYIDDLVIKLKGSTRQLDEELSSYLENLETPVQLADDTDLNLPYSIFKYESGVHRVQRVPETESSGRIHTSTASVAVLPEVHQKAVEIRDEDLEWQFMRASGAGGQSVNKTSSAVRLIHTPTGIVTQARQEKKQEQNRKIALELLRSQLWEIQEEERQATIGEARSAIGRARRSEKIRTYNFPQNRITDHRIKASWHDLPGILGGNLTDVVTQLAVEMNTVEESESSDK